MREPRFRQANCCTDLSDILPGVAPNNLTDTDNDHDSAIERPVLVPLHEAAAHCAPGKIESLQEPNASHQDHQDTNEAAENPHDSIEHSHQHVPPFFFFAFSERTRVCLSAEFAGIQFIQGYSWMSGGTASHRNNLFQESSFFMAKSRSPFFRLALA
jgi:hypothetical protein